MSSNFPSPTLDIKIGDKPVTVTMFFGLLHELAELIQVYERTPDMAFDASTRAAVLNICLAPRDERGRRIEGESADFYGLSVADAKAVLSWAKSHVSDFFLDRLEEHLRSLQASEPRLTAAGSLLTGSAASPFKTP